MMVVVIAVALRGREDILMSAHASIMEAEHELQ